MDSPSHKLQPDRCPAAATVGGVRANAAASTACPEATQAALGVLGAGGNAADAAAAAAWAIGVCEPGGSGLGGQTTALIRQPDGAVCVLDGHSVAPKGVSLRAVSRAGQSTGRSSATVPSTPGTLNALSEQFGQLGAARALDPAIALAKSGYGLTAFHRRQIKWCWDALEASGSHALFLNKHGRLLKRGRKLRQPLLAKTLERLRSRGIDDFYAGETAQSIARDMADHGGLIGVDDLRRAAHPVMREAITASYRGLDVVTAPPPGGGVTLLQALKFVEAANLPPPDADPTAWCVAVADSVYAAFRFRERWPIKPEEFTPSIRDWMLGGALARELVAEVSGTDRRPVLERGAEPPGDTTHLCVADGDGMVVSLTQSIQSMFGAKVAHPTLGFFYNNYLVTCPREAHPQRLASGCMPRSNMAPAIVLDRSDGRPRLALGAAGSRRIISALLQVVTNVIDRKMPLRDAIAAPRVHGLLNGNVWVEKAAVTDGLQAALAERYRKVVEKRTLGFAMGSVQALAWDAKGRVSGAADPRRDGDAMALTDEA